jgi:hypothetical protein
MGTACLNQAGQGAVIYTVLRGAGNLTASVAGLRTVSRAEYLYNAVMRAVVRCRDDCAGDLAASGPPLAIAVVMPRWVAGAQRFRAVIVAGPSG